MRTEEKMLILPALYVIKQKGEATTSQLIEELTVFFHPTGEDAKILSGRKDTKFSQKVRNLKSHRSSNGMELLTTYENGKYKLTPAGEAYLSDCEDEISYLFSQKFKYVDVKKAVGKLSDTSKKVIMYEEIIVEGSTKTKSVKVKERSSKLREAAIEHYSVSGKIRCAVCDFCFEDFYGEIGKGFIEIHHEKPIYQYDDEGLETLISEALKSLKPVCPNCHRMIHRDSKEPISVAELKTLIKSPS